jgi:polyferredoxin
VLIYGSILLVITAAFVISVLLRKPFKVDVIRDRGVLARMVGNGVAENVYRLQIMNTTESAQRYLVNVLGQEGIAMARSVELELAPIQERSVAVSVKLPAQATAALAGQKLPIQFEVTQLTVQNQVIKVVENSTFLVPQ